MEKLNDIAFEKIPYTASGHFLLNFYAAVYRLINHIYRLGKEEELDKTFKKYPFLEGYFKEMLKYMPEDVGWEDALLWWENEITSWEKECTNHLPLLALTENGNIDFCGRVALMVVGLVEEDSRFGMLFSKLQEPLESRRPCLELAGQIMMDNGLGGVSDHFGIYQSLLSTGIIDVINRDAPRSEWVLRVSPILWDTIRGRIEHHPAPWCQYHPYETFQEPRELIFQDEFIEKLEQVPALVQGKVDAIILRCRHGSESLQVIGSVARILNMNIIEVLNSPEEQQWRLLGPLCSATHSIPVIRYDLGPGETADLPLLNGYKGPICIIMGLEGGLNGKIMKRSITLTLPQIGIFQRTRHWEEALKDHPVENLSYIGERFRIPGGYIRQAATIAIANAALDKRDIINAEDIRKACRIFSHQQLDNLATRLDDSGSWNLLVAGENVTSRLRELESRCRHREKLLENLGKGFGSSCNSGVRALFTGASGTGKTLAVKILAAELGMDLYRVDLAAVINKYIGETEKNLHIILSRAEDLDVILLLDEADSLLGSRTAVKSANDRYANLETNYLLQRLENYEGIVVMTTNVAEHIDTAFQRRMDVVVNFTAPSAEERLSIWQLHLPDNHQVENDFLKEVAVKCAMTGGQIRNAALQATLFAIDDNTCVVTQRHLGKALKSEYIKAGAIYPMSSLNKTEEKTGDIDTFLDAFMG